MWWNWQWEETGAILENPQELLELLFLNARTDQHQLVIQYIYLIFSFFVKLARHETHLTTLNIQAFMLQTEMFLTGEKESAKAWGT